MLPGHLLVPFVPHCSQPCLSYRRHRVLRHSCTFPPNICRSTFRSHAFLYRVLTTDNRLCRERDTTEQLIGDIDKVIAVVIELCNGTLEWPEACQRLAQYTGTQSVE